MLQGHSYGHHHTTSWAISGSSAVRVRTFAPVPKLPLSLWLASLSQHLMASAARALAVADWDNIEALWPGNARFGVCSICDAEQRCFLLVAVSCYRATTLTSSLINAYSAESDHASEKGRRQCSTILPRIWCDSLRVCLLGSRECFERCLAVYRCRDVGETSARAGVRMVW
jgi:hypothetical protein